MKALAFIILTALVMSVVIFTVPQFRLEAIKTLSYSKCDTPIPYKLGLLDPKFSLSQASMVSATQNAADIWNKTYGKPLFIDSPTAALTVNFIYDQRSALYTHIDQLQNQLNQKNTTLQQQINSYESDLAAFEQKLANFIAQVAQVNQSGGATPDVYKKLIAQKNELSVEGDSLNAWARQFNLAAHDFNSEVQSLNQSVSQFNQAVAQKPEEGLYDGNDNTITIYFVNNHQELIHTLAHEFGHALEMQHTNDPQSIMYPYTTSFLSVTPQDRQQLDDVCREQLLPNLWLQEFVGWLRITFFNSFH
jgi:hypothetical protein